MTEPVCPVCGSPRLPPPTEPPVGTIVEDRHGGRHQRFEDGWGDPDLRCYHFGIWAAMWNARGPLTVVATV